MTTIGYCVICDKEVEVTISRTSITENLPCHCLFAKTDPFTVKIPENKPQYKPFDLDRALSGDKFGRKFDLCEPIEWYFFTLKREIVCSFDNSKDLVLYDDHGYPSYLHSENELVMLPKTKKLWIAVKKTPALNEKYHATSNALADKKNADLHGDGYKIIEVDIEV